MTLEAKTKITDATKLTELTVDEFTKLLRDTMRSAVFRFTSELPNPDEGKTLRTEVEAELFEFINERKRGKSLDQIADEMGLDVDE